MQLLVCDVIFRGHCNLSIIFGSGKVYTSTVSKLTYGMHSHIASYVAIDNFHTQNMYSKYVAMS